ncbi:MAG: GNAT family N-acetyltransferase [Saprospiraceae bacterium]|nr:GNAT family N-acetyltransferase [Saprospiraceae bacterium]
MNQILRTNSSNSDFVSLVKELDKELAIRDGADHSFYSQYNKIDKIFHIIICYDNDVPVGCGALKEYESDTMEVKRMYVPPQFRGQGIASAILKELEIWAKELNYKKCILETGMNQPEAIALYKKCNYTVIPNYGQYQNVENSVCFEKWILL